MSNEKGGSSLPPFVKFVLDVFKRLTANAQARLRHLFSLLVGTLLALEGAPLG